MIRMLIAVIVFTSYSLAWFGCFNYLSRKTNFRWVISFAATIVFAYAIPMLIADVSFDTGFDDAFLMAWAILPFLFFAVLLIIRRVRKL